MFLTRSLLGSKLVLGETTAEACPGAYCKPAHSFDQAWHVSTHGACWQELRDAAALPYTDNSPEQLLEGMKTLPRFCRWAPS